MNSAHSKLIQTHPQLRSQTHWNDTGNLSRFYTKSKINWCAVTDYAYNQFLMTDQTSNLEVPVLMMSIYLLCKRISDIRVQAYLRTSVTNSQLVTALQHKPNGNVARSFQTQECKWCTTCTDFRKVFFTFKMCGLLCANFHGTHNHSNFCGHFLYRI